jgi:GTP-binding protein
VVRRPSGDGTVFADIPGLIAGAAQGAGLGHEFLRHIERTRLLIHLVDASSEDVVADLQVVEGELCAYGHGLGDRPRLVVLNKIELLTAEECGERLTAVNSHLAAIKIRQAAVNSNLAEGPEALAISAVAARGLDGLLAAVWKALGIS